MCVIFCLEFDIPYSDYETHAELMEKKNYTAGMASAALSSEKREQGWNRSTPEELSVSVGTSGMGMRGSALLVHRLRSQGEGSCLAQHPQRLGSAVQVSCECQGSTVQLE